MKFSSVFWWTMRKRVDETRASLLYRVEEINEEFTTWHLTSKQSGIIPDFSQVPILLSATCFR
jgi:hypothetical protein